MKLLPTLLLNLTFILLTLPAQAVLVIAFSETESNVVVTVSGSLDVIGMNLNNLQSGDAAINPSRGLVNTGNGSVSVYRFNPIPTSISFGSGFGTVATSNSGDPFFMLLDTHPVGFGNSFIGVSSEGGYVRVSNISATMMFEGASFDSLGIDPGFSLSHTFDNGDGFTINAQPIPEPSRAILSIFGIAAIGLRRRRS